jgi:hypothetical protein
MLAEMDRKVQSVIVAKHHVVVEVPEVLYPTVIQIYQKRLVNSKKNKSSPTLAFSLQGGITNV